MWRRRLNSIRFIAKHYKRLLLFIRICSDGKRRAMRWRQFDSRKQRKAQNVLGNLNVKSHSLISFETATLQVISKKSWLPSSSFSQTMFDLCKVRAITLMSSLSRELPRALLTWQRRKQLRQSQSLLALSLFDSNDYLSCRFCFLWEWMFLTECINLSWRSSLRYLVENALTKKSLKLL